MYCLLLLLVSVLYALPFGQCIVCSSFWPVLCLLFLLSSALSALPFGQCIVCSSFWSVYCLLFLLVSADNTLTKRTSRQYTDRKEEQTIHWPKGRADNTLAKRKRLSALPFGQCIVCSSFWPVHCFLFLLVSVLSALPYTIHWPKGRADNTLTKRKSKQCTGQKEEQTIHWPKGRADNTLSKRKSTVSVLSALPFGQCIVCSSFWPMYYLLFPLASVLSALSFGQYFVCSSFWTVYCLLFLLVTQYTDQRKEQTIHWPKGRAHNTLTKRKSTQSTGQKKEQTIHSTLSALPFGQCIVCSSFWSVYWLLFLLASVLSALPFGQCIFCSSFWPMYYLLFPLASVLSALSFGQYFVCSSSWTVYCLLLRKSRQYTN
jgi:RNA polymerase-binding transcription factor DksA